MADISKIRLPSGNEYDIKDAVARQMISGGVSFSIVWTQIDYNASITPSAARLSSIPKDVVVHYNGGSSSATGTMEASSTTVGTFYLIYRNSDTGDVDYYDEYVTIEDTQLVPSAFFWELMGSTKVDLSNVVTDVTLNKQTTNFVTGYASPSSDSVIGADATFTVTQPTISVTPSTTYLKATASGGGTAWNNKDSVSALTGYSNPTTDTFVKSVSAETDKKLVTTSVTGVQASTTTASKATAATSQTTADGTGTASTVNTDWLKGVSVSSETLTIGAATMDTQTTTQFTFSDVTVPIKNSSATTVATGSATTSGTGAAVVTDVTIGSSGSALTDIGTPVVAQVIGTAATFTNTQPTVTLATESSSATGRVQVATGISSATASGGNVAWNSKDTVTALTGLGNATTSAGLNNSTSITVTKGSN